MKTPEPPASCQCDLCQSFPPADAPPLDMADDGNQLAQEREAQARLADTPSDSECPTKAPGDCGTNNCPTASHDDTRRKNKRNGGATRGRGTKESFVSRAKLTALTNPVSLHKRENHAGTQPLPINNQ